MDNFDLKRFLVENKLTRNSILLNENQIPQDIEEFLNNMINFEVLDDLSDNVEEGDNVNGVWEIEEYGDEEIYGEAADDFKKAYQYIKNNGGKITIPGNPDVTYNAIYDGSIGYSLNVTLNELDYDLSNNSYFGTPTTTFDTFDKFGRKPRKNTKWTKDTLEQEADKYTTSGEFQKANVNVYNIYRAAVRKGLIQDKFERFGFGNKWTKDALEQEANKYNSATEFNQNNGSAYQSYINAVNKGLIQNKFKRSIKWTKDALEQEAAKYNTSGEFQQNNNSAYVTYINAVNKGLIQSKFKGVEKNGGIIKWTKDALEQEAAKYNTSGEFQKANINAYTIYRTAVRKGLIPNKFEEQNKWTKDALEQEASKYNSPAEFQKSNVSAYQRYREAVNKGLIPDRFEDNRINVRWTPEKLEQEAAKYTTQNDFFKTNQAAFVAYKRAAKKGLIQDKFKKDKPTLKENKMQDFDLKRFLIENKLTRNSILFEMANILKWTPEKLEQEAAKYTTSGEFQKANRDAYQSYRNAVNKGLIQNKFKEQFRWTPEKLEQEAAKYNTPGEFQKANASAYTAYRIAISKGLIQNKFEIKWTKDALEQEADKYATTSEFQTANFNAYQSYRRAVNNGLIQNKFKTYKTKSTDALEQEAAKYNTPKEFRQADSRTYYAYMYAVKKGLIQNKFKPTKDDQTASQSTTQSINYPNNNPYFGTPTTTFDKLKENKMNDFDLKKFLVENKMTRNSRLLNEQPETEGIPADDPLAQIPAVPAETPSEPSGEIDKETAKELIFGTKGKFFTVTFIKKDGSERVMNARLGVKKYLRGGELRYDPAEFNYITVYDMGAKGYRMVNANTIQNLKIGKNEYVIPTAVSE